MTSSIGQPGEAAKVTIRGFGSVNADNAPLYVVDGAIFSGDISSISPSDIESMTILKDAASTSLYGSSAGNGVVFDHDQERFYQQWRRCYLEYLTRLV